MRTIFLVILLAGAAMGFGYPWYVTNFSGDEMGTWRVSDGGAFRPVTVALSSADEPVRVSAGVDGDVPSKPFGDASEYTWAPDGQSLVFSARLGDRGEAWSTNFDLYRAWVRARRAPQKLTAGNPAMDTGPVFSADGRTLYYRAMKRPGFEADRFALMAMDLASGATKEIAPRWDASADAIALSADGQWIYTTAGEMGRHPLFRVSLANGEVESVVKDGSVSSFDLAGDTLAIGDRLECGLEIERQLQRARKQVHRPSGKHRQRHHHTTRRVDGGRPVRSHQ